MEKVTKKVLKDLKLRYEYAFDIVVNTYRCLLYGIIYKEVRSHYDAEDVLVNTFQKMWDNVDVIELNVEKFKNWLITIAYNEAKNFKKGKNIYSEYVQNNEDLVMETLYDTDSIYLSLYLEDIKKCLSDDEYKILIYKEIDNMSYLEISKIMKYTDKTIKTYHLKAMKVVRRYFKGDLDE